MPLVAPVMMTVLSVLWVLWVLWVLLMMVLRWIRVQIQVQGPVSDSKAVTGVEVLYCCCRTQ